MDCTRMSKLFPALMAGDLPAEESAAAEEHLLACETCSRDFEAYEARFFQQYEPAGKALAEAAKAPMRQPDIDRFHESLQARLTGPCGRVGKAFPGILEGGLDTARAAEAEEHLQRCDSCSRDFETYETRIFAQYEPAGKALAAARGVLPPEGALAGFYDRVRMRIAVDRKWRSRRLAWSLNAAALLVIAVSIGYLVQSSRDAVAPAATPGVGTVRAAQPPRNVTGREVRPVASDPRSFSLSNYSPSDLFPNATRRSGAIDVIQPDREGHHGIEEVRPLQDGDSVGF